MTIRIPGAVNRRQYTEPWYDRTLSGSGKFDVSGIPPSGTILRGYLLARSTVSATGDGIYVFFNNDTTAANYRQGGHLSGSTHASSAADNSTIGLMPAANSPADYFAGIEFYIVQYAGNRFKVIHGNGTDRETATVIYAIKYAVHWESSSAINRIAFQADNDPTDQFAAGSRLQLWIDP